MDRADTDGVIEDIGEKSLNAAKRGMAQKDQGNNKLMNELFGDGQMKKDFFVACRRALIGLCESIVGFVGIGIQKFPTDLMLPGKLTDIGPFRENSNSQFLSLHRIQSLRP